MAYFPGLKLISWTQRWPISFLKGPSITHSVSSIVPSLPSCVPGAGSDVLILLTLIIESYAKCHVWNLAWLAVEEAWSLSLHPALGSLCLFRILKLVFWVFEPLRYTFLIRAGRELSGRKASSWTLLSLIISKLPIAKTLQHLQNENLFANSC